MKETKFKLIFSLIIFILIIIYFIYVFVNDSKLKKDNLQINNQNILCSPDSTPWIKIISPNGGENFYVPWGFPGKIKVPIEWESCNIKSQMVAIGLKNIDSGKEWLNWKSTVSNDGVNEEDSFSVFSGDVGNSKLIICGIKVDPSSIGSGSVEYEPDCSISDYSDNSFTISSLNVLAWNNIILNEVKVPYPLDWEIRNPGNIDACETMSNIRGCAIANAQEGVLDYKIYDPNVTFAEKLSDQDAIYISARSGGNENVNCISGDELPCPIPLSYMRTVKTTIIKGLVIQTYGTNEKVLDIYNQIIYKLKEIYKINNFNNKYISFDYPNTWSTQFIYTGVLSVFNNLNQKGDPILTIDFSKKCSNNIDLLVNSNSTVCLGWFGSVVDKKHMRGVEIGGIDGYVVTSYSIDKNIIEMLSLLKNINIVSGVSF